MPTFNPPLGRETTLPITQEDHDRFVHLSFSLTFEIGEDASGSWELWTDIPEVNDDGQLITGPGEWRAVPFLSPPTLNTATEVAAEDATKKEGFVITIPAAPIASVPLPLNHTLIARMVVPALVVPAHNASYAYTHRRVLESGETRWLGNGGENGVVRVIQCEAIEKHVERKEWKGVGIELHEDSEPIVHQLPVNDTVKASILLLQSVPPIVQPIHQLFSSPNKDITHNPESLVIVSNDLRPVSIQRNSTSPVAAGLQEHFDADRPYGEILADVCKGYKAIEVMTNTPKGIVGFYYRPHGCSAHMIVHSTTHQSVKLVAEYLKNDIGEKVPIAIKELCSAAPKGYRMVKVNGLTEVTFERPADDSRNVFVFDIHQFNMLPGKGDFFPIAGKNALSQILVPYEMLRSDEIEPYLLFATAPAEVGAETDGSAGQGISEIPDLISDDGDSIQSGQSGQSGSDSPASRTTKQPSFLSWFKRFFVGFWSWLFGPSVIKRVGGAKDDDDIPASGTVTPNERTHLLSSPSPQTSAATSSTAVSPSNSPGPVSQPAKAQEATDATPFRCPTLAECQAMYTPLTAEVIGDDNQEPMHAMYTFAQQPFRFLFEQHMCGPYQYNTMCYYRRIGDAKWCLAPICDETSVFQEGYCDEINVVVPQRYLRRPDGTEIKGPWEVRWEVI